MFFAVSHYSRAVMECSINYSLRVDEFQSLFIKPMNFNPNSSTFHLLTNHS
ncbi:hypothetical protein EVA_21716 [gut metagenome]|uniref:Uncharacterized protein n=1 Tax=gut metagenome TaxID=749906 RepID=J9FKN8_9ZZZZ